MSLLFRKRGAIMNKILLKIDKAIKNYYNKYERHPNTILINEHDLNLLKHEVLLMAIIETLGWKGIYKVYGLKVTPIKYGKMQVVEVLL